MYLDPATPHTLPFSQSNSPGSKFVSRCSAGSKPQWIICELYCTYAYSYIYTYQEGYLFGQPKQQGHPGHPFQKCSQHGQQRQLYRQSEQTAIRSIGANKLKTTTSKSRNQTYKNRRQHKARKKYKTNTSQSFTQNSFGRVSKLQMITPHKPH